MASHHERRQLAEHDESGQPEVGTQMPPVELAKIHLVSPGHHPRHADAQLVKRIADDAQSRMQLEHAVEEGPLHVAATAEIRMVEKDVTVRPDEARADIIDIE